jgi:plastocyanin
MPASRRLAAALACVAVALALTAPAAGGSAKRHRHSTSCRTSTRARHGAHRRSRCHTARERPARKGVAGAPGVSGGPALGTGGAGPTTLAPAGSAPAASTPGPAQSPGQPPGGAPPPSLPHVQVTAVEYGFSLSRTTVPAGEVILQFVNHGQDEHNLNVAQGEGPPLSGSGNVESQRMRQQRVQLRAGSYTLYCSLADHRQKGMQATLLVE